MIWLRVIFLSILLIKLSTGQNLNLQPDGNEEWHLKLFYQIIKVLDEHRIENRYEHNDLSFIQFGNDTTGFIDRLFTKYYRHFNDRAMVITRVPLVKHNVIFKKSTLVVLFICYSDKKALQLFLKDIQNSIFWNSVKSILVIPTLPITFKNYRWLRHVFGYFKYEYLFNVGILFYSSRYNRIERVGYNPFASNPILIEPKYLFANKIKNLNGYQLKITQYDDLPRSIINEDGIVNGMDGLVMYTVVKYLNASYRVMKVAGDPETSYSNVIFDLVTRRADINFNHRIFWSRNYLYSTVIPIYPYEHENIVLMIPSAQVVLPYRHFIDAFRKELWIVIGLIFVTITGIWFVINPRLKILRNRFEMIDICLDLVRMHLALPIPRTITNWRERRLFWLISMYTFIVFQSYQTKLTSFLMSRRYVPNYQTVAEVNRSNVELIFSKNYAMLINHFLDAHPMQNKQIDTNLSIWGLRTMLLENDKFTNTDKAFFVTKQESNLFRYSPLNKIHDDSLLEPIGEMILSSASSYTVLKNSPFEHEISNVIRWIRESGLYDYYKVVGFFDVRRHFNLSAQLLIQTNTRPSRVQLSVRVFMPIIHMFAMGLFISMVSFLCELSSPWIRTTAKNMKRFVCKLQIKATLKRWFVRFVVVLFKK